jgi:hypothetical protein
MPRYLSYPSVGQPQGAYVPASGGLATGMTDLFDARDLSFRQLLLGRSPSYISTTVTKTTGKNGVIAKFSGSAPAVGNADAVRIGAASDYQSLSQSWLVIANITLPSDQAVIIGKSETIGSNNGWGCYVNSASQFGLFTKNGAGASAEANFTLSLPNPGFAAIVISLSPTKSILSINGKIASVSNVGAFTNASANSLFFGDSPDSFWRTFAGGIYAVAGWNGYSLGESECKKLSLNPWQIFATRNRYFTGYQARVTWAEAQYIRDYQARVTWAEAQYETSGSPISTEYVSPFSRGMFRGIDRGTA